MREWEYITMYVYIDDLGKKYYPSGFQSAIEFFRWLDRQRWLLVKYTKEPANEISLDAIMHGDAPENVKNIKFEEAYHLKRLTL
jgi:hypothetical protein